MWKALVRSLEAARVLEQRLEPPRHAGLRATALVVVACLYWGAVTGVAAGAIAGSLLIPILGTIFGAVLGLAVAAVPTALGSLAMLGTLCIRHQPLTNPAAAAHDISTVLAGLVVTLLVSAVGLGGFAVATDLGPVTSGTVLVAMWLAIDVLVTTWVVIRLLRCANEAILVTWARAWGWRDAEGAELSARSGLGR